MLKEKSLEFTEKELNEAIKKIHSDYSLIRRYLVDYKFLDRDNYGRIYKVVGKKMNNTKFYYLYNILVTVATAFFNPILYIYLLAKNFSFAEVGLYLSIFG